MIARPKWPSERPASEAGAKPSPSASTTSFSRSPRDREVLELMAGALRNREIAAKLFPSEATVKTHVRHVLDKLRLRNRAEAAAFATRIARSHGAA